MSVSQEQKDRILGIIEEIYETGFNDAMHIAKDMLTRDLVEAVEERIDRELAELRPDAVPLHEYEAEIERLKDIIEEKTDDAERYRKMYLDELAKVEQTQKCIETLKAGSHTPLKNTYAWKADDDR